MQTGRTEKIGNVVLDYSHYPEQDFYCDGASEADKYITECHYDFFLSSL